MLDFSITARDPVRQQLHAQRTVTEQVARVGHRDALEECPHTHGMLFGEHLGGRHHDRLVPLLDHEQRADEGHQRLARPHVPLQQAVQGQKLELSTWTEGETLCFVARRLDDGVRICQAAMVLA